MSQGAEFHVEPEEVLVTDRRPAPGRSRRLGRRRRRRDLLFPGPGDYLVKLSLQGYRTVWVKVVVTPVGEARRRRRSTPSSKRSIERRVRPRPLLAGMQPELQEGTYLFCTSRRDRFAAGLAPLATFREAEGADAGAAPGGGRAARHRGRLRSGVDHAHRSFRSRCGRLPCGGRNGAGAGGDPMQRDRRLLITTICSCRWRRRSGRWRRSGEFNDRPSRGFRSGSCLARFSEDDAFRFAQHILRGRRAVARDRFAGAHRRSGTWGRWPASLDAGPKSRSAGVTPPRQLRNRSRRSACPAGSRRARPGCRRCDSHGRESGSLRRGPGS